MKKDKQIIKSIFYGAMTVAILIILFQGYVSRGDAVVRMLQNISFDSYMDFFNSVKIGSAPYAHEGIYPPLIYCLYGFIGHFIPRELIQNAGALEIRGTQIGYLLIGLYIAVTSVALSLTVVQIKKGPLMEKYLFLFVLMLSLPFIFQLERANAIFISLIFILLFLKNYQSDNKWLRQLAYISLTIAVAIKIYPVFLGVLLLREKRWKEIVQCVVWGILIFFAPAVFLDGGLTSIGQFVQNVLNASDSLSQVAYGLKVNITNTFGYLGVMSGLETVCIPLGMILTVFCAVGGVALMVVADYKETWKLVTVPCLMMVLLPPFSYIYSLIFMTGPLILFLDKESRNTACDYLYLALFILIFIPMSNPSIPVLQRFAGDYYVLRISDVVESLAVLIFMIVLYIEGICTVVKKHMIAKNS